jgi:hypothetical protein
MTEVETLLAIDPGKKKLGWAFFSAGVLVRCGLSRIDGIDTLGRLAVIHALQLPCATRGIVELMTVYPGEGKSAPSDLLDVATVGAEVAGRKCDFVEYVRPRDWKGQVPKEIHHPRIRERLESYELVVAKGANHDTMDAIGLGLHALGRLTPRKGPRT